MTVVSLQQIRTARAEFKASVEVTGVKLIEESMSYGCSLAADACIRAKPHAGDLDIIRVIERFVLRRGLARWRQQWIAEQGREQGALLAKMTAPIVRNSFAERLDFINPLTCWDRGRVVPLYRERVPLPQASA